MTRARDLANLGGSADAGTVTGESLIINGDMAVAQRNNSSAVTAANDAATVDRFKFNEGTDGTYTSEQSSTAPDGFSNSVKLVVTGADTSLSASQYAYFYQSIEAQNLQHLNYGTASAKNLTLSFWVRSSKTGTYCVTVDKNDATRYHFIKEYSIDAANTWEYKTITIAPDSNIKSSGGAIANDNGAGIRLFWWLASGITYNGATDNAWSSDTNDFVTTNQVNWMDSTSNDFYITGVKLEVGSTATPFQHESYAENLAKCHRYYRKSEHLDGAGYHSFGSASAFGSTAASGSLYYGHMRTNPTLAQSGGNLYGAGGNHAISALSTSYFGTERAFVNITSSGLTSGYGYNWCGNNNTGAYVTMDAEL